MNLDPHTVRLILAALALPFLVVGLYKRWARILSFQKGELIRSAPLARPRIAAAGAAVLLLVVVAIAGAAGASTNVVYDLLFIMAGCVVIYLVLLGAASFLERTNQDRKGRP